MSIYHKSIDWLERRINLSEIFSWFTTFGISYVPLNTTLPVRDVAQDAFLKPIPAYQRWQVLGLLTFLTFIVEAISGLLLALYYQPTIPGAYETTRMIIRDTAFGWYIHQVHYWGGQMLILLFLIRMLRFIWQRVFRAPHELTWIFGAVLLFLALQASYTGEFLPWDQSNYWSTYRGLELIQRIPILGTVLNYFAGGLSPGPYLLLRFYLIHIVFIPLLMFAFFYFSFSTIRKVGFSQPTSGEQKLRPMFPGHLFNLLIFTLVCFGILLTFAILLPTSFLDQADPLNTPRNFLISWYLLPVYGLYELVTPAVGGWLVFLIFILILCFPFVAQWIEQRFQTRRDMRWVAIGSFVVFLILTYLGYRHQG